MEEKKQFNQTEYINNYMKEKYDSLRITVPKGTKELLRAYATNKGTTINGLINDYIKSLNL